MAIWSLLGRYHINSNFKTLFGRHHINGILCLFWGRHHINSIHCPFVVGIMKGDFFGIEQDKDQHNKDHGNQDQNHNQS